MHVAQGPNRLSQDARAPQCCELLRVWAIGTHWTSMLPPMHRLRYSDRVCLMDAGRDGGVSQATRAYEYLVAQ